MTRHTRGRRATSAVALLMCLALTAACGTRATPSATHLDAGSYLLALGDSYSAGYRPKTSAHPAGQSTDSFPYALARAERLKVVNYGCSGILASDYMAGEPCEKGARAVGMRPLGDHPTGVAALRLAKRNASSIKLVTIILGSNDIESCGTRTDWRACTETALAKAEPKLESLVRQLRKILGPKVPIVGLDYIDVWTSTKLFGKRATVMYDQLLDPMLAKVYATYDATFVNVTAQNLDVCSMTYFCQVGDIHPTVAGHQRIADLIRAALTAEGQP